MTRTIAGWKLPPAERDRLLERFETRYAELVADHVTLRFGTAEDTPLPAAHAGEIVGEVDDGAGVQALVVRIGGTTDRGDGSHYHITWSLGPGREAKESNDVLAATKWQRVHPPIAIALAPARWTV
ncbi:hypothetical protein [Sphingopyxis sp.]|uniref:hypothetical protein n=1 Tax=Sphingopyxis sp. TaxID=1908224 RepID=UPI0025FBC469|nr:hypothetical protein [Sphingopyxis sp.]MBR2172462.1 hypothetical protein [Sphingopyxis sp.]